MIDARMELIGTEDPSKSSAATAASTSPTTRHRARSTPSIGLSLNGRIDGDLARQLTGLLEWLDGAACRSPPAEEALRSLELTLAMIHSAESGEIVRLG